MNTLNLEPLIDGYRWLYENPHRFCIKYFISKETEDNEHVLMNYTSTTLDPNTRLCLGGATLLLQAIKEGKTEVEMYSDEGTPITKIIDMLTANSPEWKGDTRELYDLLHDLFLGAFDNNWFQDCTLTQLWYVLQKVCLEFSYVPQWVPEND